MQLLGIIPARGGSKGIQRKNLKDLLGKPLMVHTIEAAVNSGCFKKIVVTSDDDQILEVAKQYGADVLKRPDELATDSATSDSVIAHAVHELNRDDQFDQLMLLQPTSPLRTKDDIQEAWSQYKQHKPEMLISVYPLESEAQKAFILAEDGLLKGLLSEDAPFSPRQSLPKLYMPNGSIYICSVFQFQKHKALPRRGLYPFIMPRERSVDIDSLDDFALAESYLRERGHS